MKIRPNLSVHGHALFHPEKILWNRVFRIIICWINNKRTRFAAIEAELRSDDLSKKKEYLFNRPERNCRVSIRFSLRSAGLHANREEGHARKPECNGLNSLLFG